MKKLMILPLVALPACSEMGLPPLFTADAPAAPVIDEPVETLDPTPPPPPPPAARTVEEFDTTTAEDRAEAVAVSAPAASSDLLGTTNATLGSPTEPGIWIKTGLVSELQKGRVVNPANGKTVSLELRPSGGDASAGSQISLAAMRLLDIPLTALADVEVYRE